MDKNEMEYIYETYKNTVYRTAYAYFHNKHDAEDITQEVFIKRFKTDTVFNSAEHEKAWLIRVTVNSCKDILRSIKRHFSVSIDECDIACETPYENEVLEAVMELPEKYRIAIHLYYYENYSVKEIAEITGKSETAVQTQLYRARNLLKDALGKEFRYECQ